MIYIEISRNITMQKDWIFFIVQIGCKWFIYNSTNFCTALNVCKENYNTYFSHVLMHKAISTKLCNLIFSKNPFYKMLLPCCGKISGYPTLEIINTENKRFMCGSSSHDDEKKIT